jgi:hypothetical protein
MREATRGRPRVGANAGLHLSPVIGWPRATFAAYKRNAIVPTVGSAVAREAERAPETEALGFVKRFLSFRE